MKLKLALSLLMVAFTFVGNPLLAQNEPFYTTYDWDPSPKYKVDFNQEEGLGALNHHVATEFYYDASGALVEYYLEHKTIWLNSDESIEEFNKVYIPYDESSKILVNKARVIKPDGKMVELDASKILEATDEETGRRYKYFAFEGIEKGSIIEYYYVEQQAPGYSGSKITFQNDYPKESVRFDLFSPKNLEFAIKSYNGLPEVQVDSVIETKNHWYLDGIKIDKLEEEETAAYNASKQFLVYKLDKNHYNNKINLSSYSGLVQRIFEFYNQELDKKTDKRLTEFIDKNIKETGDDEQTIRELEHLLKTTVYVAEAGGPDLSDISYILDNNVASETGISRLYCAIFNKLGIDFDIVLTTDRQHLKFDPEFEAHNFLSDFLLHFPKYDTYMAPHEADSRYGFPPAYFTDNYGLFIKKVKVSNFVSGVGKIEYINGIEAEKSTDNMLIEVSFDKDDYSKAHVKMERDMTGYYAMYMQPFMFSLKQDDRKRLAESFAQSINENIELVKFDFDNDQPGSFGTKPFKIVTDFDSNAFMDKAGKKYLFKVGELIGPQMQIYQETERVLPVESEFNRGYYRTIYVDIPEGYEVANLDDINIKNEYSENGEPYFYFHSYYEMEGGRLKITANEFYYKNIIPASLYEEYRKVINSAADFNKITLVLNPKE